MDRFKRYKSIGVGTISVVENCIVIHIFKPNSRALQAEVANFGVAVVGMCSMKCEVE